MNAVLVGVLCFQAALVFGKPVSEEGTDSIRQELKELREELSLLQGKRSHDVASPENMLQKTSKYEEVSQRKKNKNRKGKGLNVPAEQEVPNGAFESDMVMEPEELQELQQTRFRRKAVRNEMKLWPSGIVLYEFQQGLAADFKRTIMEAIAHWEQNTCVKFESYSSQKSGPNDRIMFSEGAGCSSPIGRRGGVQEIMVNENCKQSMGSIAHEIAHAIGFYHEHSRPDRDGYIKVNLKNVQDGFERDFDIIGERMINDLEPYDVSSVMHYGPTFFSKNNEMTLEPKNLKLSKSMGQREGLSFVDIKTANELYKCSVGCPTDLHCKNGGFIGPNCACKCPFGLSGRDCSDVIKGTTDCGGVFSANSGIITSPNYPHEYEAESKCYWLIQGPPGSHITLTIDDFMVEEDEFCEWDYLEIKEYGLHLGGPRYCGEDPQFKNRPPTSPIEYPGNALMLVLKSDDGYQFKGFKAHYTIHH